MANLGLGYGSEFQLLRFMGRHRKDLDKNIKEKLKISGNIDWLDFDYCSNNDDTVGDSELIGTEFLKDFLDEDSYNKIQEKVGSFKWRFNSWQNWDAIFIADGILYFVEAKAHKDEFKSGNKTHGGTHSNEILNFMKTQFPEANENWLKDYYQYANRLSTVSFLNSLGIRSKLVYICFIDGYDDKGKNICKNASQKDFEDKIEEEHLILGLAKDKLEEYEAPTVFVDARP